MTSEPIYLDHNATTPVDERVVARIADALRSNFGNAASRHEIGLRADRSVQEARGFIAALINAEPDDIVFTSGATETNNLVLKGAAERRGERSTLVVSEVEHPSVREPAQSLEKEGINVRWVPIDSGGLASSVTSLIDGDTFLVSIMLANNEIGTINAIGSFASAIHAHGALLHSDATQAVGHIDVDVQRLGVDLLSFSAHKLYGPKGVGALYASRRARRKLASQILGGGHERGLRSGTLNVPSIVGFGRAAEIARKEMSENARHVAYLRNLLLHLLQEGIPGISPNGSMEQRLPGNLSVSLPGVDAEALVTRLKDVVAFSTGAACSSAKVEPSHVLMALARGDQDRAYCSVRFGVGRSNTEEEIRRVAQALVREALLLRRLSTH
jgi:cysteine desulfurase